MPGTLVGPSSSPPRLVRKGEADRGLIAQVGHSVEKSCQHLNDSLKGWKIPGLDTNCDFTFLAISDFQTIPLNQNKLVDFAVAPMGLGVPFRFPLSDCPTSRVAIYSAVRVIRILSQFGPTSDRQEREEG